MFDAFGGSDEPDVLRTATRYREHLKAELAQVDAFLFVAHELARVSEYTGPDFSQGSDAVTPRGFALGVNLIH